MERFLFSFVIEAECSSGFVKILKGLGAQDIRIQAETIPTAEEKAVKIQRAETYTYFLLCHGCKFINAVAQYRSVSGCTLKEAMEAVKRLRAGLVLPLDCI